MNRPIDERLVARIDRQGSTVWSGVTFRHAAPRRDPLSGAGARLFGGRWNPKDLFAALYLATPVEACMGELVRMAQSQGVPIDVLLQVPRVLHEIEVSEARVLDLTTPAARTAIGLEDSDIADSDWTICQQVGHAAWFLGLQGVIAPSASGHGLVLTLFEGRLDPGQVSVTASRGLTWELFQQLRG
ncbi:RES domain-containing protein [Microbacterium sp. SSW1-47]|uniref:RES family NAD+ phosphorylase n=1 Tax=Microbacterium sufflavum TaxID=2851649 RepID=UPI001FFC315B|nr:RES domain-containing protein [Microbacterium sufflavum]MCK2028077.1 RES domain-containing protein [Microbacterium sufflavum]